MNNNIQLIADIRNKLGPIKDYIETTEALKELEKTLSTVGNHDPFRHICTKKQNKLKKLVEEELQQVKLNIPEIENILNQIEHNEQ